MAADNTRFGIDRVLFVTSSARLGGGSRFLTTSGIEMQRRGIDVAVVFLDDGPAVAEARRLGLTTRQAGLSQPDFAAPLRSLIDVGRAIGTIRQSNPTVVHANDIGAARAMAIACRRLDVPLILHIHGSEPLSREGMQWAFHWLPAPRVFIEVCRNNFESNRPVLCDLFPRSPHLIVPNGIDLTEPTPSRQGVSSHRRIGCIANLLPVKRIEDFLEMARLLDDRHRDLEFCVIGDDSLDPPYSKELRSLRERLKLERSVQFLGRRHDIPSLLAGLDIVVHPSSSESGPFSVLEALRAGLPVVATSVGNAGDIIEEGVHGFLVPPGKPNILAERVDRLLRDPGLASRIGENGRQRVAQACDVRTTVDSLVEIYQDVLSGSLPERR